MTGRGKGRMCRMCLSTTAILRSIFTIFQNYNLVFIIRDLVKLQIKEDDKLPKMICKSCAVKLIRVRETFTLFVESDRKLREKLSDVDADLTDVVEELGQDRKKRKYTRRTDSDGDDEGDNDHVDVIHDGHDSGGDDAAADDEHKPERLFTQELVEGVSSGGQAAKNHAIEFGEVKQELQASDDDDDLPLKAFAASVSDTILADVKDEEKPLIIDECKQEDKRDSPAKLADKEGADDMKDDSDVDQILPSPVHSDGDSEYEAPKKRTRGSSRVKKKPEQVSKAKPKRTYTRRKKKLKDESDSDAAFEDGDDEDKDKTFEIDEELKKTRKDTKQDASEDEVKVPKKRGRKKGTKVVKDPTKPKRKPGAPRKYPERTGPVPTLHDYKCYICNSESLGTKVALIEHFSTHVDKIPYTCKECVMETVVLTRVRGLNTHMKMHAMPVKCDYCDRRYSNAAGKYYHTQVFHLGAGAPCLVNCEVCGKTCGSQNALKTHMKYHTTRLKCSHCDMVFNHPNKRRNHERLHDENRGHECVVCKKVLQTVESYDVHLKKHNQERSYQCNLCQKKFNTSSNLILHLKVHAKNDNYRPAKSWIEHYTILSRDPMHFKCNHCDRYNTDKVNNMISHLQAHFKEYECDQCHHKFATAKQLRSHYTTHTGDKPEKCKYCDKVFSTKNNLRIHLKASHPEWAPQKQQTAATSNTPTIKTAPNQTASPTVATLVPVDAPPQASTTINSEIFDGSPVNSNSGYGMLTQQHVHNQMRTQPAVPNLNILRS